MLFGGVLGGLSIPRQALGSLLLNGVHLGGGGGGGGGHGAGGGQPGAAGAAAAWSERRGRLAATDRETG
jgi:hypothetical protein